MLESPASAILLASSGHSTCKGPYPSLNALGGSTGADICYPLQPMPFTGKAVCMPPALFTTTLTNVSPLVPIA